MIQWSTLRGRYALAWLPLSLAVALALALLPARGQAEEPVRIKNLLVQVWPEYDDPGVLVMYEGELAGNVTVPREMKFRAASGAEVNATVSIQPDGKLATEPYQFKTEGDYSIISYKLNQPKFRVEFYYNPLGSQPERNFVYNFVTVDPVDNLELEVQQPLKATNFKVNSTTQATRTGSDGLKYYDFKFSDVTPEKPVAVAVSYTKTDPNPSRPAKPGAQAAASTGTTDSSLLVVVGLGAVVAAGFGYFVYVSRNRRPEDFAPPVLAPARQGAGRRAPARGERVEMTAARHREAPASAAARGSFCTNCGTRLDPGDRFCPDCGTKAKKL